MISVWRRRRAARRAGNDRKGENGDVSLMIPSHFKCPITLDLMKDPVTLSTGITYDRESIEKWIMEGNITCPITNQVLRSLEPIPNHTIRRMIQDWCVENKPYGIERIPTPRIPVSSEDVFGYHYEIIGSCKRGYYIGCQNLVVKIKGLVKESERNKRCIVSNGTCSVLSSAFEEFTKASRFDEHVGVLEEILSCLTLMFPLDVSAKSSLASTSSMDCVVWFLKSGDLSRRRNAILVLKELVVSSSNLIKVEDKLSEIEGAIEELFKLVKEPVCPASTKASLVVIHHVVTSTGQSSKKTVAKFVEMGMVSLLLETLVDCERSICEKALSVLDGLYRNQEEEEEIGRAYYDHALTVPVIVKKILRVSDLATEFSVSILWKLCKTDEDGQVLVEALQVGAFQKLLLLLQVGCGAKTKEKATELLKLLNHQRRGVLECIDSMDFKDLKRPF